jgi:dolichyl-phosphate-mannose-protein mannosyltransferase
MASQSRHGVYLDEKKSRQSDKSTAQSSQPNRQPATGKIESLAYTSEGVGDNDIFKFPTSEWQMLGLITLFGAVVRLFRIQQPSSVVFDEVQ